MAAKALFLALSVCAAVAVIQAAPAPGGVTWSRTSQTENIEAIVGGLHVSETRQRDHQCHHTHTVTTTDQGTSESDADDESGFEVIRAENDDNICYVRALSQQGNCPEETAEDDDGSDSEEEEQQLKCDASAGNVEYLRKVLTEKQQETCGNRTLCLVKPASDDDDDSNDDNAPAEGGNPGTALDQGADRRVKRATRCYLIRVIYRFWRCTTSPTTGQRICRVYRILVRWYVRCV